MLISAGYDDNFKFVFDKNTRKWHVEIMKPLGNENLLEKSYLPLIMKATIESITTRSVLILNLPKKSGDKAPKFSKDFYTSQYSSNSKVGQEIDINGQISFDVANTKVNINLEGNFFNDSSSLKTSNCLSFRSF